MTTPNTYTIHIPHIRCIRLAYFEGRHAIVPYVTIPNVTVPKLVKIPNINKNPAIPPKLS